MKRNKQHCPKCKQPLQATPIPKKDQKFFGGAKYFSRAIAMYDRDLDRTVRFMCPSCFYTWNR